MMDMLHQNISFFSLGRPVEEMRRHFLNIGRHPSSCRNMNLRFSAVTDFKHNAVNFPTNAMLITCAANKMAAVTVLTNGRRAEGTATSCP